MSPPRAVAGLRADVVGVVLAAGAGERLQPLTFELPKALCPVGNVALVDTAVARVACAVSSVAVNVHHGRTALEVHFAAASAVHLSIEPDQALGTAGAIGFLREWIAGRGALVVNADTWCPTELGSFVDDWDRERVRILVSGRDDFGPRSRIVASLLPAVDIAGLEAIPSGLYETCWRAAAAGGRVETVADDGPFVDCGTPADYLRANDVARRIATGTADASLVDGSAIVGASSTIEASVVGEATRIDGSVSASVVWPRAEVAATERLDRAIRTMEGRTVLVR